MDMSDPTTPGLSLLTTYRGRAAYLKILLRWLERVREAEGFSDFELVLVEGDREPTAAELAARHGWVTYLHVEMPGVFHKQVLLNRAAAAARGQYLMPFDVDLLPAAGVLADHLQMARDTPRCLVAGYRVQLKQMLGESDALPTAGALAEGMSVEDTSLICLEDDPSSLLEYLLERQRFGVCPCFPAEMFAAVGGVDEGFVGWGCDDQHLIEQVCARGMRLIRLYELLYFHLPHEYEQGWADPDMVEANRRRLHEFHRRDDSVVERRS